MPPFPIDTAQIVGLFMESIFYGVYLVTFFACIRVLIWSNGRVKAFNAINKPMCVAALLMFVFGSLDVAFGLRHNINAFVSFGGPPEVVFDEISNWINVMKMVDYVAQTFIGDAILLYRCAIVYDKNWYVIAIPGLLLLAGTICGIMTADIEATVGMGPLSQAKLKPFITSMLALTLATNVITTSLIVYRIWNVRSHLNSFRSTFSQNHPLNRVIRVLIESGLIYTTSILILFGTYLASNNAQLGVSNSVVQIIGITFNLIILNANQVQNTPSHTERMTSVAIASTGTIPLHMLSIQTEVSVSRHPEDRDIGQHSLPPIKHDEEKGRW